MVVKGRYGKQLEVIAIRFEQIFEIDIIVAHARLSH